MFQTELIRFLQSFSTDWLTAFMIVVSGLGYSSFYIPALICITFGIDFRKGFLLTQVILWMGLTTDLLKNLIGLPRPADVDSGVQLLQQGVPNGTPFVGKGGSSFWGLPDPEVVRFIRAQPAWSFGLPSGHVSGATAFWLGLSLLFRSRGLWLVAGTIVGLMPLSRMYLGRHFLADVLAGWLLGGVALATLYAGFLKDGAPIRFLTMDRLQLGWEIRRLLPPIFFLAAPVGLLVFSPMVEFDDAGRLFGINLAFVLTARAGLPDDAATPSRRCLRVMLSGVLYLIAAGFAYLAVGVIPEELGVVAVEFLLAGTPAFAAIWGGVWAGLKLGLFRQRRHPETTGDQAHDLP